MLTNPTYINETLFLLLIKNYHQSTLDIIFQIDWLVKNCILTHFIYFKLYIITFSSKLTG